jgi:peptidoglycan DL-endopeptidase RipA
MSTEEPRPQTALTPLPKVDDLPRSGDGYDPDAVREAFDAFRRHAAQLQAQLRVLQAAGRSTQVEPTGHAVRMDALHLIRAASEFADTIERDAQTASAAQLQRTEEEVRGRQNDLQAREAEIERYRAESERQRAETVNAAKNEAREILTKAHADATSELREAETRGTRLLEQARHQATELTNAARAEVEQTLEWARAQAGSIMQRAQQGAEQLLRAAGLGDDAIGEVAQAIVSAVQKSGEPRSTRLAETFAAPPPTSPPVSPPAEESEHPAAEAPGEGEPEPPVSPQQG